MFGEMLMLEKNNSEVYDEFNNGNFAVQLSNHSSVGRMEPDKIIEMRIRKHQYEQHILAPTSMQLIDGY